MSHCIRLLPLLDTPSNSSPPTQKILQVRKRQTKNLRLCNCNPRHKSYTKCFPAPPDTALRDTRCTQLIHLLMSNALQRTQCSSQKLRGSMCQLGTGRSCCRQSRDMRTQHHMQCSWFHPFYPRTNQQHIRHTLLAPLPTGSVQLRITCTEKHQPPRTLPRDTQNMLSASRQVGSALLCSWCKPRPTWLHMTLLCTQSLLRYFGGNSARANTCCTPTRHTKLGAVPLDIHHKNSDYQMPGISLARNTGRSLIPSYGNSLSCTRGLAMAWARSSVQVWA
mmetsp:Transcript_43691/g.88362  ORF Transcript_43691/g.88362 Transcript_43691/m.88362 type:complete len:278 (-) Transcript_43691:1309-2142(-)